MQNLQREIQREFNVVPTFKKGVMRFATKELHSNQLLTLVNMNEKHNPEKMLLKRSGASIAVLFIFPFEKEYKVNDFTTINNMVRLRQFETFKAFGEPQKYEKFTGEINRKKVEGFISVSSGNIYKLRNI